MRRKPQKTPLTVKNLLNNVTLQHPNPAYHKPQNHKSTTIELLECLKSWFRLGVFTEQDLYAIVGNLNEGGAMDALEAMNS